MADLTWRAPATEVRPSPIHGRGLFARRAIARGEIVAVKGGHVLTRRYEGSCADAHAAAAAVRFICEQSDQVIDSEAE